MAQKLSEQAYENKKNYNKKYANKNYRSKLIAFNRQFPEEMEMLDWINGQPEGGNQYVKRLVREDMLRREEELSNE